MIPLRDVIPSRTTPFVTFSLIGANALVFLYQLWLPPAALNALVHTAGIVPAETGWLSASLLTSMFLHAGPGHLLGNMLFLWIFGDNVEDRFGHGRFLLFYLLAGMVAGAAQAFAARGAGGAYVPIIGASGAIAAVMGVYFVLFPKSRVVMLIWLVFYIDFVEIPATLFLGFWLLFQFLGGLGASVSSGAGGIAFIAHLGGFVVGAVLGRVLARPERAEVSWWDQPPAPLAP